MPIFEEYVMVDWSGGNRRRRGSNDCIWIAYGNGVSAAPTTISPASRTEAEDFIRSRLQTFIEEREGRILVCCDFAYGYPEGFSSILPIQPARSLPAWRVVWQHLESGVLDDIGTKPNRLPSNRSNRFVMADAINATASRVGSSGPFWCVPKAGRFQSIPQVRPKIPFVCPQGSIPSLRRTDRHANSDTPFRLFGTGSVGSQALTGIPRLERLRSDVALAPCSAVWPFETGWAIGGTTWPADHVRIVHAEIYPSVRPALVDAVKDRGQVRAMWQWARDLDLDGRLIHEFSIPAGITAGSNDDVAIREEEGWILGINPPGKNSINPKACYRLDH